MMNSDHQLHDTEPLDNPNSGLHHRDNVTIRSGSAGSNGNNHSSSSSPHGTPTRSTTTNNKRKIKKVGFWDRVHHHYLRRTTRSINNSNYAKYGKKKQRHNNNDKLQTLLFWCVVCMVSFVFGFAWKHFTTTTSSNDYNLHPQLRHMADNRVPSNPYAKLNEQQKQQQHKTQHYDTKQHQQANINSLVIPRFDTRQYMNSKKKQHPQSVLLEGWNHPLAFRSFPYAKQTHGPIIKNIDSDYGGLSYHSLRNEDVFARVILPDNGDTNSLSDGDNVIIGAFDPDNIDTTSTALKSRNRKRKRTSGSYPQYKSDGTKILNDVTNQAELTSYYDDDSVNILPKSNDYKKGQPRACKKPEFAYNYFPSCNAFHEHNLGRVYDDPADIVHPRPEHETYKKYLAHGFYRDVWIMEDSPWIWPQQYKKEKEYTQTQTFGVEDEKRTNEMIPKAYRSTALKTFQMKHPFSDEHWEEVQLEAIIMESMTKSPRIMNLYGHCGFSTMVEVVPIEFEEVIVPGEGYQDPDTVEKRNKNGLRPYNDFSADKKLGYALEMAESLADLHGFDLGVIVHDDVQPCQWLHTPDRNMLKLGDFNRATIMQWDMVKNEYCKFNNGPTVLITEISSQISKQRELGNDRSLPVEKTEMLWIEGESDDRACPVRDGNALSDPLGSGSLLGDIMNSFQDDGEESVDEEDKSSPFNLVKLGNIAEKVTGRLQQISVDDIASIAGIDKQFTQREVKFLKSIFSGEGLSHHMEDKYYQGMGLCSGFAAIPGQELTPFDELENVKLDDIEEALTTSESAISSSTIERV